MTERGSSSSAPSGSERAPTVDLRLDPVRLAASVAILRRRIHERFPGSGLGGVAKELERIASGAQGRLERITRPNVLLRVGIGLLIALLGALVAMLVAGVGSGLPGGVSDLQDLLALLESALNDVVFLGVAVIFLLTVESRIKRRHALRHIRELRAVAHIVDMHQLSKDPDRLLQPGEDTPHSPVRDLNRFQLGRYLDYCSEILSLTSKVAALYAERFDDPVVLQAVDEVEALTGGLSAKVWQKIVILDRSLGEGDLVAGG